MDKKRLEQILEQCRAYTQKGKVANYIPELSLADPEAIGLTVIEKGAKLISLGACETKFTLQSISKIISLVIALEDHGAAYVFSKVGMEPSGDPFNSMIKLETLEHNKPLNPMINAGAIMIASLIRGQSVQERLERVLYFLRAITQNPQIGIDDAVYQSEKETGDRNRALAYFMKSTGLLEMDVEESLDLYFRLCSIQVSCADLAKIALFFALGGKGVVTNLPGMPSLSISPECIRTVLMIMVTSGMYNASGEFAVKVGIPAKSGVSGGILAVVPGEMGIGVIGPAIDEIGNSVAGFKILEEISNTFHLHVLSL